MTGVSWKHNGDGFIACYNNGEIAYWTVSNRGTPDYINTFYGNVIYDSDIRIIVYN